MAKITSIQQTTGSQYLKKIVYFNTPDKYRNFDGRQPESRGKKCLVLIFSPDNEKGCGFIEKTAPGKF
jgi:hypothetical protein